MIPVLWFSSYSSLFYLPLSRPLLFLSTLLSPVSPGPSTFTSQTEECYIIWVHAKKVKALDIAYQVSPSKGRSLPSCLSVYSLCLGFVSVCACVRLCLFSVCVHSCLCFFSPCLCLLLFMFACVCMLFVFLFVCACVPLRLCVCIYICLRSCLRVYAYPCLCLSVSERVCVYICRRDIFRLYHYQKVCNVLQVMKKEYHTSRYALVFLSISIF